MKTITINRLFILVFLLLPISIIAQAESLFNNISLGNTTSEVKTKLESISEIAWLINIDSPRFPLAKNTESHLLCNNVKTSYGTIENVVFTFADDKLSYIEAKGNAFKTFESSRKDTARTYLDYSVYVKDKLFLNKKKDAAWILNKGGMHLNLFTWENPYLNSNDKANTKISDEIPAFIKMGENIDSLRPQFEVNSVFTNSEELDGSDPNAQVQINCFGVDYLGFPRKIEARFGNNQLNTVWILTAKSEEDRIRQALIKHYGKPIFVNEAWEVFDNWKIGLRKDKPEILLLTQELGLIYKKDFFKQ